MFERLKKLFKKNNKNEGGFAKIESKKDKDSIKNSSATEVTDDSLGNVAGGRPRPKHKTRKGRFLLCTKI